MPDSIPETRQCAVGEAVYEWRGEKKIHHTAHDGEHERQPVVPWRDVLNRCGSHAHRDLATVDQGVDCGFGTVTDCRGKDGDREPTANHERPGRHA